MITPFILPHDPSLLICFCDVEQIDDGNGDDDDDGNDDDGARTSTVLMSKKYHLLMRFVSFRFVGLNARLRACTRGRAQRRGISIPALDEHGRRECERIDNIEIGT